MRYETGRVVGHGDVVKTSRAWLVASGARSAHSGQCIVTFTLQLEAGVGMAVAWPAFWLVAGCWNIWLGLSALVVKDWQVPLRASPLTWWAVLGAGVVYAAEPLVGLEKRTILFFAGLKLIAAARIVLQSPFWTLVALGDVAFALLFCVYCVGQNKLDWMTLHY